MKQKNELLHIYQKLLKIYGPQGWWPLVNFPGSYHPDDYSFPCTPLEVFEIIVGAILTQNTTWLQAEKAVKQLSHLQYLSADKILKLDENILKKVIRPAGYFNQKSVYLKEVSRFFLELDNSVPFRNDLLKVKGIGEETADSILLYAYKKPEFVVDAYTRRMFGNAELINPEAKYMEIKTFFETNLPKDTVIFQEYHALIVQHGKNNYSKKPYGVNDPVF